MEPSRGSQWEGGGGGGGFDGWRLNFNDLDGWRLSRVSFFHELSYFLLFCFLILTIVFFRLIFGQKHVINVVNH